MLKSPPSETPAPQTLGELANLLQAELVGDAECQISGLATLTDAKPGQLSFLSNKHYRKYLVSTQASGVILHPDFANDYTGNKLLVANPYLAYAKLSAIFSHAPRVASGIHPDASVAEDAKVHLSASIAANAVIDSGAEIAAGAQIGAGCFVGQNTIVGADTVLHANVSLYHGVVVGSACLFHSQVVVGSDGFGFAPDGKKWVKIHQLGGVVIGDHVELGACTTIDRGALADTLIGDGVIIDNQVQIAHNVQIGANTAIAAGACIAGSARIGENCTLSGMVGVVGHISLVDNVHVTALSLVTKSITTPGSYSSGTPIDETALWRKNAVRYGQLNSLAQRLKVLEKLQAPSE